MRKLKVKDIAPAIKLVNAINVGDDIKKIIAKGGDAEAVGVEIIGTILKKYSESSKVQILVCEFLANPFEMSAEAVADMDIDDFIENIKAIGGLKTLADFFGSVTR